MKLRFNFQLLLKMGGGSYIYSNFHCIHDHTVNQDRRYDRSVQRTDFDIEDLNTLLHFANAKYVKNHKEMSAYDPHCTETDNIALWFSR